MGAAISASLALAGAAEVLQLWRAHLNVPISGAAGDSMFGLMFVKNMQTTGWFQGTPELGAPFGQDLTGYPVAVGDLWNMLALKFLSTFLSPAATVNVFFILGFPVIAAVAYGCLRLLRVSRPFACALGAVYALLPYHFLRAEPHLFLSAYYALPVSCVLAVWLYHDRLALWAKSQGMPRTSWAALAGALLLAGTGLYYAAFTLVLLAAAGVLGSLAARKWRPDGVQRRPHRSNGRGARPGSASEHPPLEASRQRDCGRRALLRRDGVLRAQDHQPGSSHRRPPHTCTRAPAFA